MLEVSNKSYLKAVYIHLALVIFILLPTAVSSFIKPKNTNAPHDMQLITMSEQQYLKIIDNKQPVSKAVQKIQKIKKTTKLSGAVNISVTKSSSSKQILSQSKDIKRIDASQQISVDPIASIIIPEKIIDTPLAINNDAAIVNQPETPVISVSTSAPTLNNAQTPTGIFGDDIDFTEVASYSNLSMQDLIAVQLTACWNKYSDPREALKQLIVTASIAYTADGNISGIEITEPFHIDSNLQYLYEEMKNNAKNAIVNCTPLKGMPTARYDEWRKVNINFRHGEK
jgi:hypothetical protein